MAKKSATPTTDAPAVPEVEVEGDLVENPTTDAPTATDAPEATAAPAVEAGKAKLKAPPNVSGHLTYQGVSIEIKEGFVTVEHFIAKHLREAFGFTDA